MRILLDASPLCAISHPQASLAIVAWFFRHLQKGNQLIVSELADYGGACDLEREAFTGYTDARDWRDIE